MESTILIFICALSFSRATTVFDEELYHNVLDKGLCTLQLEYMETFGFYDASYRVPQGLLGGNLESYGNFQQCLAINEESQGKKVEGKYCLIHGHLTFPIFRIPLLGGVSQSNNLTWSELTLNLSRNGILLGSETQMPEATLSVGKKFANRSLTLSLGLCVPKTCTVDAVLRPYAEHPVVRFNYSEGFCRLPGDKPYLIADYIGLLVLSFLGLITLTCTVYELYYAFILKYDTEEINELLRSCSLYSNTGRLFTFVTTTRPLDCLDGIRALSVLWIVIFHTASFMVISKSVNKMEIIQEIKKENYALWVFMGEMAVDSFFALSGLLLVYTSAYKNKQLTWRSLPHFYLNRYMRLFPLLAATILLQSTVMHRLLDGPRGVEVMEQVERCRNYWWSALLHLQNIINPTDMCMDHLWYLSVDMQLYLLSPLVLHWVLRSRRAACAALATAITASLAGSLAFCFYFNFTKPSVGKEDLTYKVWYYQNTVVRSPPFFIGMLFGYVLHIYRKEKLVLPKWTVFSYYSIALVLSCLAVSSRVLGYENQITVNMNSALHRSCWALALCWLILACALGYGGPVNWFLSLKQWRFVARISYAMYLNSFMIQYILVSSGVQYYFNTITLFSVFASELMYTVVLSVVTFILFESPISTLYKMIENVNRKSVIIAPDFTTPRNNNITIKYKQ